MQANKRWRYEQSYEENASSPGVIAAVHLADSNRDGSQKLQVQQEHMQLWRQKRQLEAGLEKIWGQTLHTNILQQFSKIFSNRFTLKGTQDLLF